MSARVALLRLHREELIKLPPPTCGNGNGKKLSVNLSKLPQETPMMLPVHKIKNLELNKVETPDQSQLYNVLMAQYHYLGYTPMAGAQVRYLIQGESGILGGIGLGASAWKLAPRDSWIGWTPKVRKRRLHLILNNNRFLILPYVRSQNLASKVLAMTSKRISRDFHEMYGYAPVLLETFVECDRFTGHCYRTANWQWVGRTTGRGKKHRRGDPVGAIKDIWLFPLHKKFRNTLCSERPSG